MKLHPRHIISLLNWFPKGKIKHLPHLLLLLFTDVLLKKQYFKNSTWVVSFPPLLYFTVQPFKFLTGLWDELSLYIKRLELDHMLIEQGTCSQQLQETKLDAIAKCSALMLQDSMSTYFFFSLIIFIYQGTGLTKCRIHGMISRNVIFLKCNLCMLVDILNQSSSTISLFLL